MFQKILLLLVILGGLNWGVYGIWGFDCLGWLLGGSMGWLARTVFVVVGVAAVCLLPSLFMGGERDPKQENGAP